MGKQTRRTFKARVRIPSEENMEPYLIEIIHKAFPSVIQDIQQAKRTLSYNEVLGVIGMNMTSLIVGYPVGTSMESASRHMKQIVDMSIIFIDLWEHKKIEIPAEFPYTWQEIHDDMEKYKKEQQQQSLTFTMRGHPADFYEERQADSTHVLVCPQCGIRRYVDARFVASLTAIKEKIEEATFIGPKHHVCGTVMEIQKL